MPKQNRSKCQELIRYSEDYDMQSIFDGLYEMSSKNIPLENAMDIILSQDNIVLAYRNVKKKVGINTKGVDGLTIKDVDKLTVEEVVDNIRYYLVGSPHGYRPKPIRRKDIKERHKDAVRVGIPCIWDRLIQQCILQVMQPYCEAKFSKNSYGFRPTRSVEHAICRTYGFINLSHLYYGIDVKVDNLSDYINHSKLIKQIWSLGIRDKQLIYVLKQMLQSQIRLQNGDTVYPTEGVIQTGIISSLLTNIYLNELDQWIDSQWANHPIANAHTHMSSDNLHVNKGNGYEIMKKTNLKEMRIVRYGENILIFCRKPDDADKTLIAVRLWMQDRLKLTLSEDSKVINVKEKWIEFLGFKIKAIKKSGKWVVDSKMSDESYTNSLEQLKDQIRLMSKPQNNRTLHDEVVKYNQIVLGIQNYYKFATEINLDCMNMQRSVMTMFTTRFKSNSNREQNALSKTGRRKLTDFERQSYGKSQMLRWLTNEDTPIYPIGYISHRNPSGYPTNGCPYTLEGRAGIHESLSFENQYLMKHMRETPSMGRSIEFMDNKLALFSQQNGRCAVTGKLFLNENEIHCHHIIPKRYGGSDDYDNLVLILDKVHILIHSVDENVIKKYLAEMKFDADSFERLNKFRTKVGNAKISESLLEV